VLNSWSLEPGLLEYEAVHPHGGSAYSLAPTQLLRVRLLGQYRLACKWPLTALCIRQGYLFRPIRIAV